LLLVRLNSPISFCGYWHFLSLSPVNPVPRGKMNIASCKRTLSPVRLVLEISSIRSFVLFHYYLQLGIII
jgi:hypothetical protein